MKDKRIVKIRRQAYYQNNWEGETHTLEEDLILKQVIDIRKNHRRIGTRKLFEMLQPFIAEHNIKMGRDTLFFLLSANYLLIRKRKRRICTTNVKLLQDYCFQISMTECGDPLENAIAERINGIIKEEYLDIYQASNITEARQLLKAVVEL